LRYPATFYLSRFLYELAAITKPDADQFYQEALAAYASAPMERLLYLSSFPFGNDHEVGEMPGYMTYQVPGGFVPNLKLQRMFVETVLRRVRESGNGPSQTASGDGLSEAEQMWLALTRLERQIQQSLPDLASEVEAAKGNLYTQLSATSQRQVDEIANPDGVPQRSFDEQVEAAQKNPNVDARDQQLTSAVIGASKEEGLDHVLSAVDKISDSGIRQPLLDWLYFERAQRAIKDKKLDEARKLALRVEELDQRAWLYSRIAEESLKHSVDQTQAREVLDEVVAAADKAPNTPVTVRALLGVAYLYTKIDMNRAIAVMAEAVKRINRMEQPDFSRQFVIRKIEGKTFGNYAAFLTPGFSPENAFREIGKIDFDGMLNLASNFSDKYLRATNTLVLVEVCLQQKPKSEKPAEKVRPKQTRP
jgi:tetratricopeptide (TPR) repeat protein